MEELAKDAQLPRITMQGSEILAASAAPSSVEVEYCNHSHREGRNQKWLSDCPAAAKVQVTTEGTCFSQAAPELSRTDLLDLGEGEK